MTAAREDKSQLARNLRSLGVRTISMDNDIPSATATTTEPGRIPDLEGARHNAEYWAKSATQARNGAEERICWQQAINAWKNAAYAMADQRDARSSERDMVIEECANWLRSQLFDASSPFRTEQGERLVKRMSAALAGAPSTRSTETPSGSVHVLRGLYGLFQLYASRVDAPEWLLNWEENHRAVAAREFLEYEERSARDDRGG